MERVWVFSKGVVCCAVLVASFVLSSVASAQFSIGWGTGPESPAPDLGPTQSAFDGNALDGVQNDGPNWPAGQDAYEGPTGTEVKGTYFCTIEQLDPGVTAGAQGWQLSMTIGNGTIEAITVTQTDLAPGTIEDEESGPGGSGGFDATELTTGAGNEGAVSAIVLHLKKGTTLDPTGSNAKPATGPELNPLSVARILVRGEIAAEDGVMTLSYVDGRQGSGQPVENKITQGGQSAVPTKTTKDIALTVFTVPTSETSCDDNVDNDQDGDTDCGDSDCEGDLVACPQPNEFNRADPNNDGRVNLADPVWLLNEAFRSGPATLCADAADANDDGAVDAVVDAAFIIMYQFSAGTSPPPPFGACGADPTDDDGVSCETQQVNCP